MKFSINQKDLQESLGFCQNVIERRSTLPILSNVLIEAKNKILKITATDLDMIFVHSISNVEINEEGETTTNSSIMYDIVRKFSVGKKINLETISESKLQLESEKSVFKLNCIDAKEFPLSEEVSKIIKKTDKTLIIFPQGTRKSSDDRSKFKKGFSRIYSDLKIACLPVAINSGKVWPKKGGLIPNQTITVSILDILPPGMAQDKFAKDVENIIYNELEKIS